MPAMGVLPRPFDNPVVVHSAEGPLCDVNELEPLPDTATFLACSQNGGAFICSTQSLGEFEVCRRGAHASWHRHQTLPLISRSVTGAKGPASSFSSESCPGARSSPPAGPLFNPESPASTTPSNIPAISVAPANPPKGRSKQWWLLERLLQARPSLPPAAALLSFPRVRTWVRRGALEVPHLTKNLCPTALGPKSDCWPCRRWVYCCTLHAVETLVVVHSAEAPAVLCVT